MLLADVVRASADVAVTRSRNAKRDAIAALISGGVPEAVEVAVAMLTGEVRQGRVGIGWATISRLDVTPSPTPTLTVTEIDSVVTQIVGSTGPGSQASRVDLLEGVWSRATAAEQEFLGRLFVGELRQGALAGVMADAVARATDIDPASVRRAAMLSGDLPSIAALAVGQGANAIGAVGLTVGRPVEPMLASTAESVVDALDRFETASVEWKLDGARVQVHRDEDEIRVFTRNLNDITDRSPEVVEIVRAFDCTQIVLDGEVLGLDADGRPRAFQDTMARFGADDIDSAHRVRLTPRFFDLLHLDGRDIIDLSLDDRRRSLDSVVPEPHRVPRIRTDDPARAAAFFDETVALGHEGVMVKDVTSTYDAGRRGKGWLKIKPVHTHDLVVLAAEWGHGRRTGWLSNLHLGARDGDEFVMVGKTFKGLTDELLGWQTEQLQAIAERTTDHVVWVRPELVVEIALDGVQRSTRYPGGVALRFARVKQYRPDKSATDADTLASLRERLV